MTQKERDQQESRAWLREFIGSERTLYTCLRHVSGSGMQRKISVHMVKIEEFNQSDYDRGYKPQSRIANISYHVARATGYRFDPKHEAITINGAGMDMGFALVYNLSRVLFEGTTPDQEPRTNGSSTHGDPGYVLSHRWI